MEKKTHRKVTPKAHPKKEKAVRVKAVPAKAEAVKPESRKLPSKGQYIFGIGRRKTAEARIKLYIGGTGDMSINGLPLTQYFPTLAMQRSVADPLEAAGLLKKIDIVAETRGGGVMAQAKAMALGIARALVTADPAHKAVLKKQDFLTRDARKKERKKPGLKRARRAPQWQKR